MEFLFSRVDNTKLIVFRVLFGFVIMVECWGALLTGWVHETFVDVNMTFNFIGFEWTQVLLGETMYVIYFVMGLFGALIFLGLFYRVSAILFFILWTLVYLMQKSNYNNHYYLLVWLSFIMAIAPANQYYSLDARIFNLRKKTSPRWPILVIQILVAAVYIYAAIAKLYPGWYENHYLPLRLDSSADWFDEKLGINIISDFLRNRNFSQFLAYAGIFFDFTVIPLLLFKPTRKLAFFMALIFHGFNSIVLQVGVFPFLALCLTLFYFDSEELKKEIMPFKGRDTLGEMTYISPYKRMLVELFFVGFVFLQVYLPLRHWLIKGDVLWTDEGHRMAWRMMLREREGDLNFVWEDENGKKERVMLEKYLKPHQISILKTSPDMIWQFAQKIKKERGGKVFVKNSKLSINGGKENPFINDTVDIGNVKWRYFGHQQWILDAPKSYY